ncbi:MAG: NUDIX domain-containing protein [Thermoplasmatota archaeon]
MSPPVQARFNHETAPTALRLQTFLLIRDEKRNVLGAQLDANGGKWSLPGETMLLNESPQEAAQRIAKTWFESPIPGAKLVDVFSYPATGADDDRWYLIFIFETHVAAMPKATPDTLALKFFAPGDAHGPWAMSHHEVWERVK